MAKDTPITITVDLRFDEENRDWIATSTQGPKHEGRGTDPKQARSRLASTLEKHLGRPVEIEEGRLRLPKELAQAVEAYNVKLDTIERLSKECDEGRLPLAHRLIKEARLHQNQAAALLRISGTWLGQQLKKESTAETSLRTSSRQRQTSK